MLPFDNDTFETPLCIGSVELDVHTTAPTVQDFDPAVERLSFALSDSDDNTVFLHDLLDRRGVQVEVGGRLLVTLMGCVSKDIPDGCLTFKINS